MKFRALIAALVVTTTIAIAPATVAADGGNATAGDCGDFHVPEDQNCDGEIDEQFRGDYPEDSGGSGIWGWIADLFSSLF